MVSCNLQNLRPCLSQFRRIQHFLRNLTDFVNYNKPPKSKLDSIANIISQAMQDGDISPTELHKVLQEVEEYHRFKVDIRNQAKAKAKKITKEQQEEILEQGKKEGKEDFLRKIANTSGI